MLRPYRVTDERDQPLRLARPPQRIVSLVPSDTYTLLRLGAGARLVGRTDYCVEPAADVTTIPTVGGTKNADAERILALSPDVVVANREENTRSTVAALEAAGIPVLVTMPQTVAAGLAQVARLAHLLGDLDGAARDVVARAYTLAREAEARRVGLPTVSAFVPIWADPLMTVNGETFVSDVLATVGATNVFADRQRRYPLAADIHGAPVAQVDASTGRDTRYPRITLEEVVARAPELVLLPDEPHPFSEADVAAYLALDVPAARSGRVHLCSGKPLMWPGLMALEGLADLARLVHPAAPSAGG